MTSLGGLDDVATVGTVTDGVRPRRGDRVGGGFTDALSGPDGMADPAPWPVDNGGLTAAGELFVDALGNLEISRPSSRSGRNRPVAAAVSTAPPVAGASARRPAAPAPTAVRRAPAPARRAPQATGAVRQVPRPSTAPTAPRPPAPAGGSGTAWSMGGVTARDFLRQAREAGGLAVAASPFLRVRPDQSRVAAPAQRRPSSSGSTTGRQSDPRAATGQPRRRPGSTIFFVVFVLAVLLVFGSGLAATIVDAVRSLLNR